VTSVADRKCFDAQLHELINNVQTKQNVVIQKNCPVKGLLRQVFIRLHRLEIQSIMLVFSTPVCELLPLSPSPLYLKMLIDVWLSYLIALLG
jgi:hypothetical protein